MFPTWNGALQMVCPDSQCSRQLADSSLIVEEVPLDASGTTLIDYVSVVNDGDKLNISLGKITRWAVLKVSKYNER